MGHLIPILLFTALGSVVSLLGGIILLWREKSVKKWYLTMVGFAAGVLLGAAFFDLLPESLAGTTSDVVFSSVAVGILLFFFLEKFLLWYHSHTGHEEHTEAKLIPELILFGDATHNFIDGAIIAAAFASSYQIGLITTLAVFLHEIPQEIGDFTVLRYTGLSKKKVILFNLYSALTAFAGALISYLFTQAVGDAVPVIIAFAAGGFLYIAISELLPELIHKETVHLRSMLLGISVLVGLLVMKFLTGFLGEG